VKKNFNFLVVFLISIVVRFWFLGLRPFDGDEGIILKIAKSDSFSALIKAISQDVHPPFYHILEYFSLKILPLSEFSARFVSALAGLVAVYFIYLLFKKISSEKTALAVALLSTINPALSYHFAEVRPYGVLALLVFAQIYFFLKIKDHSTAKSEDGSDLFWFTVTSFLMIMTQYISFAILIGEVFHLLICEGRHKINYKKIISGIIILGLFALTWGNTFANQLKGRMGEQSQALNLKENVMGLFNAIYRFFSGRMFLDLDPSISKNVEFFKSQPTEFFIFILSLIIPLILFVWGIIILYKRQRENFWLIFFIFSPVIIAALLSSEIGPRSVRYLLFLVPFCLYIVLEVIEQKQTIFKNVLFTLFIFIYIASFMHGFYIERKKPGVNKIAEYITLNAKSPDQILVSGGFGGGERLILEYYLKDNAKSYKIYDLYGDYKVGNLSEIKERKPAEEIKKLKAADSNKNLWYYDFTYNFKETDLSLPFVKVDLGKDKENKDLIVYKF
jgi:4-amino-4-deoxy-L-arabinose transferase-like glycosyltransferase